MVTEQDLTDNGKEIIQARRHVWDLERKGARKNSFEVEELKTWRREYHRLLKLRRELIRQSQIRAFE